MKKKVTKQIVEENKETYNRIAEQFSSTRRYPWSEFSLFNPFVKKGDRVLDIGCGNGRLAEYFLKKEINYTGVDNSEKLIALAREKNPESKFIVSGADQLPFGEKEFDSVFLIATLHHIPSADMRQKVLNEACRVLKPGGYLIMTEWNLWSKQWWLLLVKSSFQKITGQNKLDWGDIMKPWKDSRGNILGHRYLHPFNKNELKKLLNRAGFTDINQYYTKKGVHASWYRGYNIFTSARKP